MESDDAIMAIARCSCGHGIGRHDESGCPGTHATFCVCTQTPSLALDAAIERVRHIALAKRGRVPKTAVPGTSFELEKMAAELNSDDYACIGPVRTLDPGTMLSMLTRRLVRAQ